LRSGKRLRSAVPESVRFSYSLLTDTMIVYAVQMDAMRVRRSEGGDRNEEDYATADGEHWGWTQGHRVILCCTS